MFFVDLRCALRCATVVLGSLGAGVSAAAWAQVKGLDVDTLFISHIQVNQAQKQRRRTYRAHGRINRALAHTHRPVLRCFTSHQADTVRCQRSVCLCYSADALALLGFLVARRPNGLTAILLLAQAALFETVTTRGSGQRAL